MPAARTATSASRRAPTIPRSPSTPSATSTRIGRGTAVMRWSQLGFGRTSSTTRSQETPRNLMGFKDGTNNVKAEDAEALDRHVWVEEAQPAWLQGGSYLVARRIRMLIEIWDRASLLDQERTIGRMKVTGAPLGAARGVRRGRPRCDGRRRDARRPGRRAHPPRRAVRERRHPHPPPRLLVHGRDGPAPRPAGRGPLLHQLPERPGFVRHPAAPPRPDDALNEYITHNGSALFAVPPGNAQPGGFVGEGLFA